MEKNQTPNVISAILVLVSLSLGYGFIHHNIASVRPSPLEASAHPASAGDPHKVESRLWQDPFDPFEPITNQDKPAKADAGGVAAAAPTLDESPWHEIAKRADKAIPLAIIGVMLEGGSYAEDKEVRLRMRYAVELALLTGELIPEDRSHISTNALVVSGAGTNDARTSRFAYEWFSDRWEPDERQACVLWLNEDDLADNPALRLNSVLAKIPNLTNSLQRNCSFYLIGPRSSDTLRNLATMPTNGATAFIDAAKMQHFKILSPEATAQIEDLPGSNSDPRGTKFWNKLNANLGGNVFHNWIVTDQALAALTAQEMANRISGGPLDGESNVVVILSEQDTYFGSGLADLWISSMVDRQVCHSTNDVWQFAYLRGLDGSKAPKFESSDPAPDTTSTAETLVTDTATQQQRGEKADGNAQMDYVDRLGKFLQKKDGDMKEARSGRIVGVGFTGSDTYDKLILIHALRYRLPEAVFFTTDLEAPLWTENVLPYTRNLLVASAYPLDPDTAKNGWPRLEEFPPLRDVYQAAVFRACNFVVNKITSDPQQKLGNYDPAEPLTSGAIYTIGKGGPVKLELPKVSPALPQISIRRAGWWDHLGQLWWDWLGPVVGLVAVGLIITLLTAISSGGIRWPKLPKLHPHGSEEILLHRMIRGGTRWTSTVWCAPGRGMEFVRKKLDARMPKITPTTEIERAEALESSRQITWYNLPFWILGPLVIALAWRAFILKAHLIAILPGEEPWDFTNGISIWPSQCVRALAIVGGFFFLWWAFTRVQFHRRRLWEIYFRTDDETPEDWEHFWKKRQARWRAPFGSAASHTTTITANVTPLFVTTTNDKREAAVNAFALFKRYLHAGRFPLRLRRAVVCLVLYLIAAAALICYLRDIPTWLLVRGPKSHEFDRAVLSVAISVVLLVLFYVLDATLLTKKVLRSISLHPTHWPDRPLRNKAVERGVAKRHLDGLLDVEFAAIQTKEIGQLMLGPVTLLLLLIVSRSNIFDSWTWPPGLIIVFFLNFACAAACWFVVRRAARKVRELALDRLNDAIFTVKDSADKTVPVPMPGDPTKTTEVPKQDYLRNLELVRKAIKSENRGAYSRAFQDPTYLAVFIPSGVSGIAPLISSLFFNN